MSFVQALHRQESTFSRTAIALGSRLACAIGIAASLAGCAANSPGTFGLDFGAVLAKEQQVFVVNGAKAALRRYPTGAYDIKLYGGNKIIDLGSSTQPISVVNTSMVGDATLIVLDSPEPGCGHVYEIYRVAQGQSNKWQNSYRSCDGPMVFGVYDNQWTARPTVMPRTGEPYILVYQDGNLYTRPLTIPRAHAAKKHVVHKKPIAHATKAAPAHQGTDLDTVAASTAATGGTDLDAIAAPATATGGANLDDIALPPANSKIDTAGLQAAKSNSVILKEDKAQ